jgi:transcriptional regulator NrdR family protein
MKCPVCDSKNLAVLNSRRVGKGIRRLRECQECLTRFHTHESIIYESMDKHILKMLHDRQSKVIVE